MEKRKTKKEELKKKYYTYFFKGSILICGLSIGLVLSPQIEYVHGGQMLVQILVLTIIKGFAVSLLPIMILFYFLLFLYEQKIREVELEDLARRNKTRKRMFRHKK